MRSDANNGDAAALQDHIDFPVLKENIIAHMKAKASETDDGSEDAVGTLAALFVDSLLTPENVAKMLRGGGDSSQQVAVSTRSSGTGVPTSMGYRGLSRFVVSLSGVNSADKPSDYVFTRYGLFSWKLTDVRDSDDGSAPTANGGGDTVRVTGQVSDGMRLADGAKTAMAEVYANNGRFPPTNSAAGLAPAGSITGPYVSSVDVSRGRIAVTFGKGADARIGGKHLVLVPKLANGGIVSWACSSPDLDPHYLPQACQSGASSATADQQTADIAQQAVDDGNSVAAQQAADTAQVAAQVSNSMSVADMAKTALAEFYANIGHFPPSNSSAGLDPAGSIDGPYVSSLDGSGGRIVLTFGNGADSRIAGKHLLLVPKLVNGLINWSCRSDDLDPRYLPQSCQGEGSVHTEPSPADREEQAPKLPSDEGTRGVNQAASSAAPEIEALLDQEAKLNDQCRGGSGDDPRTNVACNARDKVFTELASKGWCWGSGAPDQIEADKQWQVCSGNTKKPLKNYESTSGRKELVTPTPSTPPYRPTKVTFSAVWMGSSVDANNRIRAGGTSFAPQDKIYASVETIGNGHATLAAKWTYQDGQTVHEDSKVLDTLGPESTAFMIRKPSGFPEGNYRVEFSLDGQPVASKDFSVRN